MKIKEIVDFEINNVLVEFRTKFSLEKFKSIKNIEDKIFYATEHLRMLHKMKDASSRVVFLLSNRFVLKIANPLRSMRHKGLEAGISQNKQEVEIYTNNKLNSIVTKIYDFDPGYEWLISELVRPIKNKEEFEKLIGLDFYSFEDVLSDISHEKLNYIDLIKHYIDKIKDVTENKDDYLSSKTGSDYYIKAYKNIISVLKEKKSFFEAIVFLIREGDLLIGDLLQHGHWGKTPDNRVVLLDYGLSTSVYEKHYE